MIYSKRHSFMMSRNWWTTPSSDTIVAENANLTLQIAKLREQCRGCLDVPPSRMLHSVHDENAYLREVLAALMNRPAAVSLSTQQPSVTIEPLLQQQQLLPPPSILVPQLPQPPKTSPFQNALSAFKEAEAWSASKPPKPPSRQIAAACDYAMKRSPAGR